MWFLTHIGSPGIDQNKKLPFLALWSKLSLFQWKILSSQFFLKAPCILIWTIESSFNLFLEWNFPDQIMNIKKVRTTNFDLLITYLFHKQHLIIYFAKFLLLGIKIKVPFVHWTSLGKILMKWYNLIMYCLCIVWGYSIPDYRFVMLVIAPACINMTLLQWGNA